MRIGPISIEDLRIDECAAVAGDALVLTDILLAARRQKRTRPEEAVARARWVVAASAVAPGQERLFAQSVQLLSHLTSPQRGFHLVPYLDRKLYAQQAAELLAALEAVDADLRVVDDREHDIVARHAAAEGLLARIGHTAELTRRLIRAAIAAGQSAAALVERARKGWEQMPAAGDSMRPEDWDLLRLEMAPMIEPAIKAEVPGAGAYLKEIEKLVVRGKAGFFAESHMIECAQRYQAMVWTLERDRADQDVMRAEIDAISAGEPLQHSLRLRLEHARDDIRSRVVLALENPTSRLHASTRRELPRS